MPELPEVETVVRMLAPLKGRVIREAIVLHKPTISGSPGKMNLLNGRRIERIWRRAKFIRIDLDGNLGLAIHLRMTGWLGVLNATTKDPKRDPYIRVRFALDDGAEHLVFNDIRTFGRVWCGTRESLDALPALKKLGPEPFEISPADFAKRLRSKKSRLKSLLLDQEFLAGVGNIYADESLFRAGLHPLANAANVSEPRAKKLLKAIQDVLQEAIDAGGSSVENFKRPDGESGWFQRELRMYGRDDEKCLVCGTIIKRILVGQRSTCFCSKCQKK
jgi:formamidopyrimidine-DNA glycosylase